MHEALVQYSVFCYFFFKIPNKLPLLSVAQNAEGCVTVFIQVKIAVYINHGEFLSNTVSISATSGTNKARVNLSLAEKERGTDRGVSPESTGVALAVFLPKQMEWQREVSDRKAESA